MKTAFRVTAVAAVLALLGLGRPAEAAAKKPTATPAPAADASKDAKKVEPVDINTADVRAIAAVPGVGDKLATEIVKGRPYKSADDLQKVKGIGKKNGPKLAKYFTFGESKAASKPADAPAAKSAPAAAAAGGAPAKPTASPSGTSSGAASDKKPALAPGEKININTASAEQLDRLPGIGPSKAQAILDYRAQQRFGSIEDIMKVKGIKEGEFAKIKDLIKVR